MNKTALEVKNAGCVTASIKEKFFKGWTFQQIRIWLEANGIDRHMPIELQSTEIALVTPFGILMQIRSSDNDMLGLWGGVLEDEEKLTHTVLCHQQELVSRLLKEIR